MKQSILPLWPHGLLRGACHPARVRATRWLAMTLIEIAPLRATSLLSHRRLHQQRRHAAGAAAHGHAPRSRLAAGADFRDIDSVSGEPRPCRVDIGNAPADAAEP